MRTITEVYTKKRKEIREHNEKLKKSKIKKKVTVALIREFLLKGKTKDEKFDLKMKSNEAIAHAVDLLSLIHIYRAYFSKEDYVTAAAAFEPSLICLIPMSAITTLVTQNLSLIHI